MKKLFKTLLVLALGLILSLSAFACKQSSESEIEPEPIVAVDGVNVQNVIDALGPINDSEYLTVKLDYVMSNYFSCEGETSESSEGTNAFSVEIKLKKTVRGYDFIATITPDGYGQAVSTIVCYYIDGRLVMAYEYQGEIAQAEEVEENKTFNGLLNDFNKDIAEDAKKREVYEQMLAIANEIEALFKEGVLANVDEEQSVDLKEDANGAFTYLKSNSQKTIYELIVDEAGITQTEEEVEGIVMDVVNELCADNPTLATFIDRVVDVVNQDLDAESQIDVREICNALETEGLSAVALCELVNLIAGEEVLASPQTTISLYDYLTGLLSALKVDDLAVALLGDETATVADLATMILDGSKTMTVGALVQEMFGIDLATYNLSVSDMSAFATVKTDANSRFTKLAVGYKFGYTETDGDEITSERYSAEISIEISYERFDTEMVIPEGVTEALTSSGTNISQSA